MCLGNQFSSGIRSLPAVARGTYCPPSVFRHNAQATGDGFCWCGHLLHELHLSVWQLPLNILLVINLPVASQRSATVTTWRKLCLQAFNLFNSLGARFNAEWVQISMRSWSWTHCIPNSHDSFNWSCPLIEWRNSQTLVIQDDSMYRINTWGFYIKGRRESPIANCAFSIIIWIMCPISPWWRRWLRSIWTWLMPWSV